MQPLPGEPGIPHVGVKPPLRLSRKSLLALSLLLVTAALAGGAWLHQGLSRLRAPKAPDAPQAAQQPAAATTVPRRLDLTVPEIAASAPLAAASAAPLIPALDPTAPLAEPIPVRRTGTAGTNPGGPPPVAPEDAPVLLLTSRPGTTSTPRSPPAAMPSVSANNDPNAALAATSERLEGYQRQLQGLLRSLEQGTAQTTAPTPGSTPTGPLLGPPVGPQAEGRRPPAAGLLGGTLPASSTERVVAGTLGHRSLTLPKGTAFTCALKTRVVSATAGLVGCQVQRNVYSDDGRVLLIERGSHLDGEYRVAAVRPGTVRIPVLWTRVRTPLGVVVALESPATGPLGESGLEGYVDNRWTERLGAAMLVSLIDDALQVVVQNQNSANRDTVVLQSSTGNASQLAEKVLESTINIPPLLSQHQGGLVGIYVARDVDFSSVYELHPGAR
ncbi:type IV secretion system protein VirB10 [Aquincola sp. J276]|uniref:type IV secretion system protein VirB10 n=1 Tax=Aquincola sp. J276 TaxID=2898432 RepID=UPI00215088C0|nr:type IV secretion system protein VirB10 [Aquincola sp. J276]MCR5864101.1 type IV secretion system protein VirB10 [Aquincola sp. J276]